MRLVNYQKKRIINLIFICIFSSPVIYSETIIVSPSDNSQDRLQEAMILANPGDTIQLTSGVYDLEDSLSLDVDSITIQGVGHENTILNFSEQKSGAQGLMVTSDDVILKDFAVKDYDLFINAVDHDIFKSKISKIKKNKKIYLELF